MEQLLIICSLAIASVLLITGGLAGAQALRPPVPAQRLADYGGFVNVGGLAVHLWQKGRKHRRDIPIILIHGFGASNWCWRHTITPLSKRRWVLAPDLPGFGLTDKPGGFDYSLSGYARFIVSFMDEMGIQEAVLVGNSMGGGVAVSVASSFPGRVRRLVLIDSLGYYKRSFHVYRFIALPIIRDLVMSAAGPRSIGILLKARVYHDPSRVDDQTPRRFAAAYRTKNGRKAPIWVYRGLGPMPMIGREDIRTVGTPTLIIWGEKDRILPVAHAVKFGQDIAGSVTMVIPGVGHVPHEEQPDLVNKLISDFITETGKLPSGI